MYISDAFSLQALRPCKTSSTLQYFFFEESLVKTKKAAPSPGFIREEEEPLIPAVTKKKVMVVGGGPGGLWAALVASRRGHRVILYEKEKELGGKLIPGSKPSFKDDIERYLDYLRCETADSDVKVHTDKMATEKIIRSENPDALIIALGAKTATIPVNCSNLPHVMSALDVLCECDIIKGNNVVVIGGGDVGCETALYLRQQGKDVTVIDMLDELMAEQEIENPKVALKDPSASVVT